MAEPEARGQGTRAGRRGSGFSLNDPRGAPRRCIQGAWPPCFLDCASPDACCIAGASTQGDTMTQSASLRRALRALVLCGTFAAAGASAQVGPDPTSASLNATAGPFPVSTSNV